jgi:hypothetical protein
LSVADLPDTDLPDTDLTVTDLESNPNEHFSIRTPRFDRIEKARPRKIFIARFPSSATAQIAILHARIAST